MACDFSVLKEVPLFALLDDDELTVLAGQVELRQFAARQRIYRKGDLSTRAFIMVSGSVQVSTIDEDNQVVVLDMPIHGDVFGFASMRGEDHAPDRGHRARGHGMHRNGHQRPHRAAAPQA